ncbi:MAG TPA: MFS transporter [Casimicrobiaceae bacterium]|nr:MFS transporter [Casimicrobiaceae bacterium]
MAAERGRAAVTDGAKRGLAAIPRGVWVLGAVSLCMDTSSELVHSLLPLYLAVGLGASTLAIGVIEGVAEATALVVKVFSGVLSDAFRRRKPLLVAGYGLAAVTKLVFPLAPSFAWVVGARFADRVGKGIRGAPRDALLADLTPQDVRGASFGLRQTLDTVGAVGGPLLAIVAMAAFAGDFRTAFWVAVVPAFLAVALLVGGISEPARGGAAAEGGKPALGLAAVKRLGRSYAIVVAIAAVLTLARFSEAFLVLRARDAGLSLGESPWVMVVMSLVFSLSAYPAGAAADRGHGPKLLSAGLLALVLADLVLANAASGSIVLAGAGLWGLHMGLTQGLLAALVAAAAPEDLRGTAFGVYNLVCGLALLAASALAGWLWDAFGPAVTFYAGAAFTVVAWVGFLRHGRKAAELTRA